MIEAYKKDVDLSLIRRNLRLSVQERIDNLVALQKLAADVRKAGREAFARS